MKTYRVILKDSEPVQIERVSRAEKNNGDNTVVFYDECEDVIGIFELQNIHGFYRYLQLFKIDGLGDFELTSKNLEESKVIDERIDELYQKVNISALKFEEDRKRNNSILKGIRDTLKGGKEC